MYLLNNPFYLKCLNEIKYRCLAVFVIIHNEKALNRVFCADSSQAVIALDDIVHIKDILPINRQRDRLEINHDFRDTIRDTLLQAQYE